MGKIRVLDEHVANQIAAGEVVERPASVVKECVENSIDAGSTSIEITIEEGGLEYIRVLDNGSGMAVEDCELAFLRHATSKISEGSDLFHIRSLGFRGEALPSIAAVAKVECTTAIDDSGLAHKLIIHGGKVIEFTPCAAPKGTDLQVRQLFFNTPARLKYMKTVQTELNHITDFVYRMALAHPHIKFVLKHNGQTLLQTLGNGDRIQTIAAIYGTQAAKMMEILREETIDYRIEAHVAKPEYTRSNRNGITIIVNGRVIKNYAITNAVIAAYHTLLPLHRFPLAIISIQTDPVLIDVNVHPAKHEIRFSKEQELTAAITDLIRSRLLNTNLVPQIRKATIHPEANASSYTQPQLPLFEQRVKESMIREVQPSKTAQQTQAVLSPQQYQQLHDVEIVEPTMPMMFPVGQIHGTYIVAQNEQGMYLIDQHAAHERLNYERFYQKFANPEFVSQELMIPITLSFTPSDVAVIQAKLPLLEAVGVFLESFGGNSFIVRAYPAWLPDGEEQSLIEEMIDYLLANKTAIDIGKIQEKDAIMCACKASLKANQSLSILEMEHLIHRLRHAKVPFTCPHGRPIVISFSTYDLEKMFKRVM